MANSGPPSVGNTSGPLPPDVSIASTVLGIEGGFRVLAIVVVAIRLFSRFARKGAGGLDDVFIGIASIFTICGLAATIMQVKYGLGRLMLYIPEDHAAQLMQWLLTAIFLNVLALFFMRISVCFFVLRLLPPSKTWKSWPKALTYATLFVNFISTLINCLGFGLWCRPLAGLWNHQIKAKCYSYHVLVNIFRVSGVLGALSDFSVALIPVFIVMGLQMDFRTKISISIVLGLGFLTAACSIAKVIVSINPDNPRSSNTNVGFLSTTEECFGIIIASLPALHQLFVRKRHASALPVYAKDGPSHQSSSTGGQKSLVRSKNKGSGRASMELQEMLMQDEQIPSKKNSESSTREEWISKKTEVHISASHRSQRDLRSKFNTRQSNHYGPNDDTFAPWANNKSLPAIPTDITDAR